MIANLVQWFAAVPNIWKLIGFSGQALFAARFIVHGFQSEREGRGVIPLGFWYCSLGGGVVLLAYALYVGDAVFIVGQGSGLIIYSRNPYLIFRERAALHGAAQHPAG